MMLIANQTSGSRISLDEPIVVGLVNNMPDSALRTTERQFQSLLSAASDGREIRVRYFSLPELFRGEAARARINERYEDLSELWPSKIDGLVVTGTEPRASELRDEPYWATLTKLVDWAESHTNSSIWSCLAAHAAVLHLDGISRRRLPEKLSGVFCSVRAGDHQIVSGTADRWSIPHSRYNDLPEELLAARAYRVLSRSAATGADWFVKEGKSLFVFIQGHPEYERATLLHEYRRDVARFLSAERDSYPVMPCGYFDDAAVAALASFREQALSNRCGDLLANFPAAKVEERLSYGWRDAAVRMYANWVSYLAERKSC